MKVKSTVELSDLLYHRSVFSLAFSPDGRILAAAEEESIGLYDTKTGKKVTKLGVCSFPLVFSPDGKTVKTLAVTNKGSAIKTWELTWGKDPARRKLDINHPRRCGRLPCVP